VGLCFLDCYIMPSYINITFLNFCMCKLAHDKSVVRFAVSCQTKAPHMLWWHVCASNEQSRTTSEMFGK